MITGLISLADEWVFRVERIACAMNHELTVKFVSARLGEDFNAAVAKLIVFGRKRILVDTDFADGGFRGQLPGGKAVDVDLTSVRSGRWSRKRGQFVLHLVGIVGKRFQVLTANSDGIG